MSRTVLEVKETVLHKMREFSNAGVEQTDQDYLISIVPLINLYQEQIARDTKKIEKIFEIAQNNPDNMLGTYDWNEDLIHTDEDVEYSATGAKAYSFQVSDYATVYIEESTDEVSWSTLYTITKTATLLTVTDGVTPVTTALDGSEGYLTVKGKTNLSVATNYVRIRFSGSYRYLYRWVALFEENFYSNDEVPSFEPWVPYNLPSNMYEKKNVRFKFAYEQDLDFNDFRYEIYSNSLKRIYFNWYLKGEFVIEYYSHPDKIPEPEFSDLTSSDAYYLDIADEGFDILVDLIASNLLKDENSYISDGFKNSAYIGLNNLIDNEDTGKGFKKVINANNW